MDVPSAADFFQIDEYNDLSKRKKPTIVVNLQEIVTIHSALASNTDMVVRLHRWHFFFYSTNRPSKILTHPLP